MRAVHFGAGNIGRGFVGPILSNSGYEVCFVGRNKHKIEQLQKRGKYRVTLANNNRDSFMVDKVSAIHLDDIEEVAEAVAGAEIVTTAVGLSALKDIAGPIAEGLELRLLREGEQGKPLHVIACENGIASGQHLKNSVYRHMTPSIRELADKRIAFPNVMVDRIVPVQKNKDPLEVLVEPYSEWIIPRNGIIAESPKIDGAHFVNALDPYLERKLFTVNTGHCSLAYFGYLEGYASIQEAMEEPPIRLRIQGVLEETGALLTKKHGFDPAAHERYIKKTMERFANPNFNDTVTRIARSPLRKLSPHDRLVKPAMLAHQLGLETSHLVSAIASALLFDYAGDPEALSLQESIRSLGLSDVITEVIDIPPNHPLHKCIVDEYHRLLLKYPHLSNHGFTSFLNTLRGISDKEIQA